ncbi:MAG: hypothetical protein HY315_04710 [Acidobacteria bacterium]|nr:hypothetical protein [Acidobacteriota bacterium]
MSYIYTTWAGNLVLLLLILFRGVRGGMLGRYKLFYTYVAFSLAIAVGAIPVVLFFGMVSRQYYYFFNVSNLFLPLLQLALLWNLRQRIIGNDKTPSAGVSRWATLLVVMTAPAALGMISLRNVDGFTRYHAFALLVQVMACMLVCGAVRSRADLDPGRNLKGILLGLSLMVGFQGINFARYLFRDETFHTFSFFVPFIYVAALIVFAHTLWSYEPMFTRPAAEWRAADSDEGRLRKVNEQLQQALKSLLLPR